MIDTDKLVLPFAMEEKSTIAASNNVKFIKNKIYTLFVLDIGASLNSGVPIIEPWTITDEKKLQENVEILEKDPELLDMIVDLSDILYSRMSELDRETQLIASSCNGLKYFVNDGKEAGSEGQIIINTDDQNALNIVFKTIDNNAAKLKNSDIEKLAKILNEIITNNLEIDTKNDDIIRRLSAEVSFKVIEALPPHISADDINVNTKFIIEEINKIQSEGDSDDV